MAGIIDPLKKDVKKEQKEWHPQQSKLLKSWAEVASSYRWMHNQAYMVYKKKNLNFMLPLIIMSTVTGTANFAQATFPDSIRPYVPQIIGAINLISAIMTTIYQFLKISEFMESHRISSINYGKLARTITVELNLPVKDRNSGGADCVKISRTEIDRLIEQSPSIPKNILASYEEKFAGRGLSEPEIIVINSVDIYEDIENKNSSIIAEAGMKLKNLIRKPFLISSANKSPTTQKNEEVKNEINFMKSNNKFNSVLSELSNKLNKKTTTLPLFEPVPEPVPETIPEPVPETIPEPVPEPVPETIVEQKEEIFQDTYSETTEIVNDVVEDLVHGAEQTTQSISDDLELLRRSKIVSLNKK